ncbi:MAG: ribosome silencing factor [candidate division WOR-3 bacterium]|nr:ribosome silencing factor [candidate division WOR-3 bacterium]
MSKKGSKKTPLNLAKELARIISDKKGEDIVIFDLRDISPITDYFVIATGLSDIHNRTIAEHLSEFAEPDHIEGLEGGGWILLDYIDVVVHIFSRQTREFYGLERLWGDAPQIKI